MAIYFTITQDGWHTRHMHIEMGSCAQSRFLARVDNAARDTRDIRALTQVHSAHILDDGAFSAAAATARGGTHPAADGLVTAKPHVCLTIRSADCLPVYVFNDTHIALLHVGWRGLRAGIIHNLGSYMDISDAHAVIGPCICAAHYEVGPEVYHDWPAGETAMLTSALSPSTRHPDRKQLDLAHIASAQLAAAGLSAARQTRIPLCTYASALPSYRRDGPQSQRIINYITRTRGAESDTCA